ncbi:hypothetical protein [Trueperella sp.]|uniref:hypothetical protein n=1 Tax=Trueperella sp. TaxID=2699835 RepID=UPI003736432E
MSAPARPAANATERVLAEIRAGATVPAVARRTGTSEVFVKTILDHFDRLGMLGSAASLCSSDHGACSPGGAQTEAAKISCAGCAFAR